MPPRVEIYPLLRLFASLAIMTIGATGMYAVNVSLKPILVEFDSSRAAASLPYAFTMVGFGLGGILMGRISDRVGVFWPVLFASFMLSAGFAAVSMVETLWQLCVIQGVMIGLLGSGATFAPLVADTSHWFTRRRGIAVGIVISGNYLAGAIWPPIIQDMIDTADWRFAYMTLAVIAISALPVLSLLLCKRAKIEQTEPLSGSGKDSGCPLGFAPNTLQCARGERGACSRLRPRLMFPALTIGVNFAASAIAAKFEPRPEPSTPSRNVPAFIMGTHGTQA